MERLQQAAEQAVTAMEKGKEQAGESVARSQVAAETKSASTVRGCGFLIIAAVTCAFLHAGDIQARDMLDSLGGPGFNHPQAALKMPKAWLDRPVQHVTREPVDLAITLDQQLYPALAPLIREFRDKEGLEIAAGEGTCGTSAGAVLEKTADIGGFCCPPGPTDRLPGLRFHTIGIGPVALIVHPENPIVNISLADARRVFSGKIKQWSKVPGSVDAENNLVIRPVIRLHCKLRPGHWRKILDTDEMFGPMSFDAAGIIDMILIVGRNRSAIGFAYLWQIERYAQEAKVKMISLDGVNPRDRNALAKGEYPLYRVFNLTTWDVAPAANPGAQRFVAYIRDNLERIDSSYHIIPVQRLREAGWGFAGSELVGGPD